MLQMFYLDVRKVDMLLHVLQLTPCVAVDGPTCIRVGVEGARAVVWETVRV
jgi:hypothetical protein